MTLGLGLWGAEGIGQKTESAGTRIQFLIGGRAHQYTHLLKLAYTAGATAHLLTVMRGQSYSTFAADAEGGQKDVVTNDALLDGAGNAIATSDLVAYKTPAGNWVLDTVASVGTPTTNLTLTTNLPSGGVKKNAPIISYGVPGDSGHNDYTFDLSSGGTTTLPPQEHAGSVVRARRQDEPLLIDVNNATNAGQVDFAEWGYSTQG